MPYLACLAVGFCLGTLGALKVAEALLANLKRDIDRLEKQLMHQPEPAGAELAEDFV